MATHLGTLPMSFFTMLQLLGAALVVLGAIAVAVRPMSGRKKRIEGGFSDREVLRD